MEFKHTTLDNGLDIIAEVNPAAASMAAGFFAKTGSRDETPQIAGVSHFLEHMMFKGTKRRGASDVNLDFDRMGANYNAFTSEENTVYHAAVLPEFQTELLDLLGDMLRPQLRREDFDLEKNVILDEIARYQDIPSYRCYEMLMSEHFAGHPLGNGVLGTVESIRRLERADMQAYFERRYSPSNVIAVGVGNLDFESFVAKIAEMCSGWEPFDAPRQTPAGTVNVTQVVITDKNVAREHIGMMSPAPSCQDSDRYAAQVAATIIGDTTGSRLFHALIEPAIADEAHTSYDPLDSAGGFITFISTDAERAGEAVRIARDQFGKLIADGPTAEEIKAATNKIASGATLKGELPMGRLIEVGFDWVYRGEYLPLADQIARVLQVSKDELAELIRRYDLTATTVLALGPLDSL